MTRASYVNEQRRLQRLFDAVEMDVGVGEDNDSSAKAHNVETQEEVPILNKIC